MNEKQQLIHDAIQAQFDKGDYVEIPKERLGSDTQYYHMEVPFPKAALPMSVDSFNRALKAPFKGFETLDWRHGDPMYVQISKKE